MSEEIKSHNGSLHLVANEAIQMESGDSAMILDSDVLLQATTFKVSDSQGQEILHLSPETTKTNFRVLTLSGKAQALKSLQAQSMYSKTNMIISSPTKGLKVHSVDDLSFKTSIGKFKLYALKDLDIEAKKVWVLD